MRFKRIKQRGQVLALYGLLIPFLLLFVGVGLDLGWYYLNVSRLQNAADAAALAGAQALVQKDASFDNYYVVQLASNQLPADFDTYSNVFINAFPKDAQGIRLNYLTEDEAKDTLLAGQILAEQYARHNLEDTEPPDPPTSWKTLSATDSWNGSAKAADKKVTGTIDLKYKKSDGKNDKYGELYYVVSLHEKIRHFLLPGWFEAMDAPVRAVVLLQPHHKGLITPMEYLERTKVIDNWEYTNKYKGTAGFFSGKWNHYMSGKGNNNAVKYAAANPYRTEGVSVTTKELGKDGGQKTEANGNTWYTASEVDSINIDFQAEVRVKSPYFTTDWDLNMGTATQLSNFSKYAREEIINGVATWGPGKGDDKRILFNAEFDDVFPTRDDKKKDKADPLWVRIESEPILLQEKAAGGYVDVYNSVRQITLNFNTDNSEVAGSGENQYYKNRPYVIFYTGPENINHALDENGVPIRHSQPVVVNLNEDTNAIMYFPESPVVLNGNGHKLTGFVIAKCFLYSVTEEDMTNGGKFEQYDGFNAPKEEFTGDFIKGLDSEGQTVYFHNGDLLTSEQVTEQVKELYGENAVKTEDNGNIVVKDKIEAPKYLLLDYSKNDSQETYKVTDDGEHDEYATFANYVNSTYKEKFKSFSGLTDSQISAVTFPDENYNFTGATYYVDTYDLLPDDPDPTALPIDDRYVKVLVDDEKKFIDKRKLPYVKIRTNQDYFYVCVYDLKLAWDGATVNPNNSYLGVRMIDGSYTDEQINNSYGDISTGTKSSINASNAKVSDADIFINPNDKWCDSWGISGTRYSGLLLNYKNNWKKDKLTFVDDTAVKYFMLNSEVAALPEDPQTVAKYHAIKLLDDEGNVLKDEDGKEVVRYIRDDDDPHLEKSEQPQYYTKVQNNALNANNYIIVDKNGNMLTKTLTHPDVFEVDNVIENAELEARATASSETLGNYWKTYTREPKDPEEIPGDEGKDLILSGGLYRMSDESDPDRDYRIPALERVYLKKEAFNLSENSKYSYFFIEDLWRTNYTYLNVDEFAKTVNRKTEGPGPDGYGNWDEFRDDMFFTYKRAKNDSRLNEFFIEKPFTRDIIKKKSCRKGVQYHDVQKN